MHRVNHRRSRSLTRGLVAGAAGTTALNAVTYLDIVVRARPPSRTPEESVRRLAERAGVELGPDDQTQEHRLAGLGPLLGYLTGLGTAVAWAVVTGRRAGTRGSGLALAALAMAGSNLPMARLGVTDPRKWTPAEWASDAVPHLAYGMVTAAVLRRWH